VRDGSPVGSGGVPRMMTDPGSAHILIPHKEQTA